MTCSCPGAPDLYIGVITWYNPYNCIDGRGFQDPIHPSLPLLAPRKSHGRPGMQDQTPWIICWPHRSMGVPTKWRAGFFMWVPHHQVTAAQDRTIAMPCLDIIGIWPMSYSLTLMVDSAWRWKNRWNLFH